MHWALLMATRRMFSRLRKEAARSIKILETRDRRTPPTAHSTTYWVRAATFTTQRHLKKCHRTCIRSTRMRRECQRGIWRHWIIHIQWSSKCCRQLLLSSTSLRKSASERSIRIWLKIQMNTHSLGLKRITVLRARALGSQGHQLKT